MASSTYKVQIPELAYTMEETRCHLTGLLHTNYMSETCVCLLKSDLKKLVVELKAACVALGGNANDCQLY